jgi:hypothetical protein
MGTIQDMINRLEHLGDELEGLKDKTFMIPIDSDGMIDRQCPKDECKSYFKVNDEDWSNIVKDEEVFCPFCRNKSIAADYLISEHRSHAVEALRESILNVFHYGSNIPENAITLNAQQEFALKVKCESCNTRYAVIGAAYFCPCCGYNSITNTALEALERMRGQISNLDTLKKIYEIEFNKDDAVSLAKYITEKTLVSCISTLQSFAETSYNFLSASPAKFNIFQNITEGNKLWINLTGQGYIDWLTDDEYFKLNIYAQRRHLLEHKNGIVDDMYLKKSDDKSYQVGDRVIVNADEVLTLLTIIEKIVAKIKTVGNSI